ncbi:MAG: RND family transporter [Methanosarcinales archaeon]|nr:RND family transporter [Methanosarcinales archaeon]
MRLISGKERLGVWIEDNPIIIIAIAALLTLLSLHYAQQIEMQGMQTENFVGKDSPLYQAYDHLFLERFGTESIMVIVEGDDVTTPSVLKAMDRLSRHMEALPMVMGVDGISQIVVQAEEQDNGIRGIPDDQQRIDSILQSASPQIDTILPDKRHTILAIEYPLTLSETDIEEILRDAESEVRSAEFPPGIGVTVTGSAALGMAIKNEMAVSNGQLMALCGILMIIALLLVFKHVNWPLLPLPIVFLGIIWTFGIMGLVHIPMTMISMSAFPILIGIGIDYAIQLHSRIEEEISRGGSVERAVIDTVVHTAPAVLIALSITAAGFVSLLASSVPMTRDFGLLCLIGLVMCYLSALFVEVTILNLVERRRNSKGKNSSPAEARGNSSSSQDIAMGALVERAVEFSVARWKFVLVGALVLALAGTYADTMVPVDTDFKNYIPQDLPPLVQFRHLNDIFGSSDEINIIVQGDDITNPSTLRWMDDFQNYLLESRAQIYGAVSITNFIKMYNNGEIPSDSTRTRAVLDSMPEFFRDKYLDGHDTAVIDLNIGQAFRDLGPTGIDRLIKELEKDRVWFGPPPGITVVITGDMVVMTTVIDALTTGRTEMSLLGLVLIFVILLVIYRDIVKALVPVLPMLVVIGWMGGVMYIANMSYTPLTATLGALILGVGSEYSILMMERFYEELERVGDYMQAMRNTSNSIGSALVASGMTTVFGFAALMASPFVITSNFGVITVMAVIFALLTTFTVFPVLLIRLEMRRCQLRDIKLKLMESRRTPS